MGRFLSEDPIGYEGSGENLYRYAENDPVNLSDPMGLDALSDTSDFIGCWGDSCTLGITKGIRGLLGADGVNACSGACAAGGIGGMLDAESGGSYSRPQERVVRDEAHPYRQLRDSHRVPGFARTTRVGAAAVAAVALEEEVSREPVGYREHEGCPTLNSGNTRQSAAVNRKLSGGRGSAARASRTGRRRSAPGEKW